MFGPRIHSLGSKLSPETIILLWRMELEVGSFSLKGYRCCTVVEKWNRMETREESIVVFKDNFPREDMHLRYFFPNSMMFALNFPCITKSLCVIYLMDLWLKLQWPWKDLLFKCTNNPRVFRLGDHCYGHHHLKTFIKLLFIHGNG